MMTSIGEEANGCEEQICSRHFVEDAGRNCPGINAAREKEREIDIQTGKAPRITNQQSIP